MTDESSNQNPVPIDRSERQGHIGIVLLLTVVIMAAIVLLRYLNGAQAQVFIFWLLAVFAAIGVFCAFAFAVGVLQLSGRAQRNDLTRTMADSASEGLLAVEADGRIVYANEGYAALTGSDPAADLKPVERVFTGPPDVSEAIYRLAQAAREGRRSGEEIRLAPALDGRRDFAWYKVRVRPLPKSGPLSTTLWDIADITHDRERQENIFQELQHAIDYLDHAPAGFLSLTQDGKIVYMNATLAAWLDYDLASVGSGGFEPAHFMSPDVATMLTSFSGKPGDVRTETVDIDLRRRNGTSLPVRLFHHVAFGQDGLPGPSRTLVIDRSAGRAEDEDLRAAEVRFARLFNNTPIAIATVDRNGGLIRANASFSRLFGTLPIGADRVEGYPITKTVIDAQRDGFSDAIAAAAAGRGDMPPLELKAEGEQGRSMRLWVSPIGDAEGVNESVIVYALETTELRQIEEQLAQAQKMNAVGQLAGGVAHDFNNVLQAIIGYCDLLLANHRPTDPSFQDIMQIRQNANRAAGLVRQLLAFSRRQTLRPQVLTLSDTLSELSNLLRRLLGEKVTLELRHGRDLWPVLADVNQFETVIVNLAVNARDAMPDGGKLTIRTANVTVDEARPLKIGGMPKGDYVMIEVADAGSGMAPEVLEKIFEPFFTTKDVGKGTGLGLSTVFGIVKQSGGFIEVQSAPGEGSVFQVYLPRYVAAPKAQPEPGSVPVKPPVADHTGQGTILLVEDDEPVRAVNARALTARGYTVLEAASGIEALAIIEARNAPVDLVVSDVVMPEMDGPTLLGELRKRYPDLKVVFVSGYAEDAFRRNLPEGEEFNFLPKPFSLKKFVETVKDVIAR